MITYIHTKRDIKKHYSQWAKAYNSRNLADYVCEVDRAPEHLARVGFERQSHELHRGANIESASRVL